ncbi:MAG: DEAD/DEAH box helicase, partial [Thermoplasmata archaeon]|nr:DEAD/DEAH box helicase [Candidatus Sysuiplasma superficiale]
MMKAVFDALSQGRHLILESPTGSGKTASVLSSIIENAGNRKILYLTRTNSQQRQVMIELRKLTARRKVFAIAIQGRNSSCLLAR